MREIEIKARVDDLSVVIATITKSGAKVSEPVSQHDRVYGIPGVAGASDNKEPWLRIRTETNQSGTKHYFTLKKSITSQLDSIEHETEITDDQETAKIIELLGFVPYSDLTKSRQKARIGDMEICIDTIVGLGNFVEAEVLTSENADVEQVTTTLWKLFESFGIKRQQQIFDGYDVLMNKHLGRQ